MTFDIDATKFIPFIVGFVSLLVGLIIGWMVGFRDSNSRTAKKISEAETRAEGSIQQVKLKYEETIRQTKAEAEEAKSRAAQAAEKAASAVPAGNSLLRLWVDAMGAPQLDLDGQPVNTANIFDAQRKRLIQLITAMRPWIEARPGAPAATVAPIPAPAPVAPRPVAPAPVPVPAVISLPGKAKDEKPAKPLSMVAQIDEILQIMLSTSSLAGRGIRLTEAPGGGVNVIVGLESFAGVGEVTDPEIQALLRTAIAEWEKKYTPG